MYHKQVNSPDAQRIRYPFESTILDIDENQVDTVIFFKGFY